ncbi:sensor histidine kinase [Azospirillum rugosum]|uniref:histidine kinase n=1 Tax=Azospirillum rugosum TaxID=416170 RepID=A0ABS4SVQ3_9PROT|nr:histidine kinase dimerization/phosphoacceptor domain -containing protein [Azospirillum rugosum]MBP2296639.1 two-component sensor histidine kinase [Azospirillum rugosum]MDQ0530302.1 two-component sensor histidine kinase [Azospirillum rugosum]
MPKDNGPEDNGPADASPAAATPPLHRPRLEAAIGWLAAAGLVFLLAVMAVVAYESRQRAIQEATERAESAAHVLAEHTARLFDASDLLVEHTAQRIRDMGWNEIEASNDIWGSLRAEVEHLPFLNAVWLNDETGRLRLSTIGFPTPPSDASDRDSFLAHLSGPDRPYISELIVGRVTRKPTFLVSRRLGKRDGSFRGIASVTVDPAYFEEFYRNLDLPSDPSILLFRADDLAVLVHHPDGNPQAPAPVPDFVRRSVTAHPAMAVATGDGGIVAHRRVENWPVHVAVRIGLEPVLADWRAALAPYAGMAALAAAALLVLSAFGFRQAHAARLVQERLEARVQERTASLETALAQRDAVLAQKDLLMREANHRIKNSLQVVSSLLSLQGQSTGNPETRESLHEAGRRVHAVSDIHQLLYKVDDIQLVPFHEYLTALCRDLERSALAESDGWRLTLTVEPVEVPSDQAVPLGLIANELLMNAVKHAYPGEGPGLGSKSIAVSLRHAGDSVRLTIEDEGVGLPDGFDWRRSRSLGMRLVHALTNQLDATLSVEPRRPGTSYRLDMPLVLVAS